MIPAVCAPTPRTLWIELTSKCPADCVFCSRKLRRGAGEHFPFAMFESLVDGMRDARRFVLNYSGESTVYPDLIPAIQRARASGAYVELVSVLVTAPESMVDALAESGLNRLTVSVHAADEAKYAEIYRYGSLASVRARLERIVRRGGPMVDLAFVAMDSNLSHLGRVAALAESLGIERLLIFPVIRRDEIAVQFPLELLHESHRPEFEERVRREVETAEREHPSVRVTICNDNFNVPEPRLGDVPSPYPRALPEGAHIHSCEQNPWETAHVLANGDVVACEVLDKIPLGNLHAQKMDEIWHGDPYQRFRERYRRGEVAECHTCPWKRAYVPRALTPEILGSRGNHAQLLYGWHDPANEDHIWSSQHAVAILAPRRGSRTLHVSGMLPQGPAGQPNELTIRVNGCEAGSV
jgi:MoaA/NifB/PqqE/SkfB family radical SAM enzyme